MKSEFEFIQNIRDKTAKFRHFQSISKVGIGDDCAVLPKNAKTDLVITTDLLIEDIDFRLNWSKPEFIGHKALAVSLSDVAAMGATPVWAMLSIGIPEKIWKSDFVERFYKGWFALAEKFSVELVGGDVSKSPDKIVIDSIVSGEVRRNKAILRSGAKAGDLIFVTGELGGAAGGLKLLQDGFRYISSKKNWRKHLLIKQMKPIPKVSDGQFFFENNLATAMIDLSDGISSDLMHICQASNVGARIFADKIPFDKKLKPLTESHAEKIDFVLNGGEDFELLFTANQKKILRFENEFKNRQISLIGEINSNVGIIELIQGEKATVLEPKGFRHF